MNKRFPWVEAEIFKIKELGLYRTVRAVGDNFNVDFTTNDYLNLSSSPELLLGLSDDIRRLGARSSRVVSGTSDAHIEFESRVAKFMGQEASLFLGSGYLANLSLISSCVTRNDLVVMDKFAHASIVDGVKLSGAKFMRFTHNNFSDCESIIQDNYKKFKRIFLIVESIYSMDGDQAPLRELVLIAKRYGVHLIVDEAHAFGVWGGGLVKYLGLQNEVFAVTANCSKALGGYGGIVSGPYEVIDLVINKGRGFIYSTALPEAMAKVSLRALQLLEANKDLGNNLRARAYHFRKTLKELNVSTALTQGHIVPVIIGSNDRAQKIVEGLGALGIRVYAFRSPTVPIGTERLRLSLTLAHSYEDLDWCAREIVAITQ